MYSTNTTARHPCALQSQTAFVMRKSAIPKQKESSPCIPGNYLQAGIPWSGRGLACPGNYRTSSQPTGCLPPPGCPVLHGCGQPGQTQCIGSALLNAFISQPIQLLFWTVSNIEKTKVKLMHKGRNMMRTSTYGWLYTYILYLLYIHLVSLYVI